MSLVVADVLHDHVHVDVGVADRPQDLVGDARTVRHAQYRDLGLVPVGGDARDDCLFHVLVFLESDQRAFAFLFEARKHAQPDAIFAGELHGADLQHLGAEARELQHLLERNGLQPPRVGHDARVGGVDPVHVGVNLTLVGLERGRQRDAGRVGAAAPERGDVPGFVDALEARDDDDAAVARSARIFCSSMERMRALVCALSVRIFTCAPV